MSESNWTIAVGSAGIGDIDRGVTQGVPRPNGGGSFLHAHHALTSTPGAHARYVNNTAGGTFSPMPLGGIITGAVSRFTDGNVSIALFMLLQGTNIADGAYSLGLGPTGKIVLRKWAISEGFPTEDVIDPPNNGVLAISTQTFPTDKWMHLYLGCAVQAWGEVDIYVRASDPDIYPVTAPSFASVPGMNALDPATGLCFIDDQLGINSGSQPYVANGRAGWCFSHNQLASKAGVDHLRVGKQP